MQELAGGIAGADPSGLSDLQRAETLIGLEQVRGQLAKLLDALQSAGPVAKTPLYS